MEKKVDKDRFIRDKITGEKVFLYYLDNTKRDLSPEEYNKNWVRERLGLKLAKKIAEVKTKLEAKPTKKEVVKIDKIEKLRKKYNAMSMKDLRQIGNKYKVYDTSKSELAEEIIEARIKRKEI